MIDIQPLAFAPPKPLPILTELKSLEELVRGPSATEGWTEGQIVFVYTNHFTM